MDLVFVLDWPFHFEVPVVIIVLGLIVGLSYAVLALGLVVVYKSTRVVNLAHGEIGAFAAAALALVVNDHGLPYWLAAIGALLLAGVLGAVVEMTVIRRLFHAPRLMLLVATLGLAQLFLFGTFTINDAMESENRLLGFPIPFSNTVEVGALVLRASELMILVLVPLVALGLAAFFRFSSFGVAVRAAAENGDSARLVGIRIKRVSTFVWVLAAMLSALTALMLAPGKGINVTQESLGPDLLMRALAAAVLARMTSLPRAFAAGIAIGLVEKVVAWNYTVGVVELVLFVVVLGSLLLQHRGTSRSEETSSWAFSQVVRPIPRHLQSLPIVRWMNWGMAAIAFGLAALLPLLLSNSQTYLMTTVLAFAIAGLSVTVLTGFAGQISLGQIAFFGIGAATSYQLTYQLHVPFWISLLLSGLAGSVASVVIGVPALRIKGLLLSVSTLGFALVTQKWLLGQPWLVGTGVIATRPYIGPLDFASQRAYYFIALAALAFAILLTRNVLRGGIGRNFVTVRDNEAAAAAFTVPIMRTKLLAFAFSGFLAAFAGAVYGHGVELFQVNSFPVTDSLRLVAMVIVGGLGSIPGTIAGAIFVVGGDRLLSGSNLRFLTTSIGLLLLLLYMPGGLAQLLYGARDRLLAILARRSGGVDAAPPDDDVVEPALEAVGVS